MIPAKSLELNTRIALSAGRAKPQAVGDVRRRTFGLAADAKPAGESIGLETGEVVLDGEVEVFRCEPFGFAVDFAEVFDLAQ